MGNEGRGHEPDQERKACPMTFEEVYDEHFNFVWRSLRRLGVSEADVQDAAQDVFVIVYNKLAGFEGRSKISTWLFSICMHIAKDRRRSAHERRRSPEEIDFQERADPQADVGAAVERRQGAEWIEIILNEMPDEQRAAFVLFELEAQTCEQIASLLGIPLGTVYSRLRLAREAFKKSLARLKAKDEYMLSAAKGRS